eukprot:Blabericola_migrator_1__2581@NODE_172_length_12094_cov_159_438181_g149_i0_p3_GENE_NODE_172_length_12094_cov_159_438181_g149_i0NODE_172_length_12094_cov_159_438181_g149_i0_p3_ORF_typecomplete_len463_score72_24Alphaamylase/PF00128_24/3_9e43hDGE_amylase/PF14701_6/6_2e05hDGE_amylase/PF14701_6/3e03GHL10/PF02638_15/0_0042Alphaamylase_C/PF02806_18/0_0077Melibiase/PF02065_18/0_0088AP_endonuc_2/PF01261_24/2_2AP_endonuc_2/PF01261_24/2_3e02AP_endonuc_2/PF01261_24/1_1e03GHL6/PF14871_6/0_16Peptidase_C10/PF01
MNMYECHVGSFGPSSKFDDVPVEHVADLGFNTIELMPVQEFGGSWGYNPRLLMAIHPFFGTPCDLRRFVSRCHGLGLKVVLDVVLNHGSAKRNSLWNFDGYGPNNNGGIYFEGGKETGWGRQFNFASSQVLWYIRDTCKYFLEDMNVDGLRFDSVHNMGYRFTKDLVWELRTAYPDRIFIAEVTPENPKVCTDQNFHSVWVHADYYDAMKLLKSRGSEWDLKMLCNILNGHTGFSTGLQMIGSILGSHDQVGNRHNGHSDDPRIGRYMVDQVGGRNNWHARAQCRMMFALQALGRQVPMVFQGSETLQGGWWNIDIDHHWDRRLLSDPLTQQFMTMVKDVNALRASSPWLQAVQEGANMCHKDGHNLVIAGARGCDLVVVNWGENQWEGSSLYGVSTPWPNRDVRQLFNSQAEEYGGWEGSWSSPRSAPQTAERTSLKTDGHGRLHVILPKWSVLLFRSVQQ